MTLGFAAAATAMYLSASTLYLFPWDHTDTLLFSMYPSPAATIGSDGVRTIGQGEKPMKEASPGEDEFEIEFIRNDR